MTRMDIPLLLGTIFTDRRGRASVIGYVIHFANGLVFALAYYGDLSGRRPRRLAVRSGAGARPRVPRRRARC